MSQNDRGNPQHQDAEVNIESAAETNTKELAKSEPQEQGKLRRLMLFIGLIALKAKSFLLAILKIKGVASIVTMVVSVFTYWWLWHLGFWGAVGFVGLIFVHEAGHALAMKALGIEASLPVFIPGVGAFIAAKSLPDSARDEAIFAIAGPAVGSLGALACLGAYHATNSHLMLWLASIGFMINLFNLIPVSPLDGGRIIGGVWRGFWFLGLAMLLAAAIASRSDFLCLILILGLMEVSERYMAVNPKVWVILSVVFTVLMVAWQDPAIVLLVILTALLASVKAKQPPVDTRYFALSIRERLSIGVAYVSLSGLLLWLWFDTTALMMAVHPG